MEKYERSRHGRMLMHYGVVSQLLLEKHDMKQRDLNCLLYFYGRNEYFKYADIKQLQQSFPDFHNMLYKYIKRGWFQIVSQGKGNRNKAVYGLSPSAAQIVSKFYRQLFGEIPLRTDCERTTIYGKALPMHRRAVETGLVNRINEENIRLRLSLE